MSPPETVRREVAMHPGITGTWHHYGHLTWHSGGKWLGPYDRPECPVSQLASAPESAGCGTICERLTDDEGRGGWFCANHGTFRVFDYPTERREETEQATIVGSVGGSP